MKRFWTVLLIPLLLMSCSDNDNDLPAPANDPGVINVTVSYKIDQTPLYFDSILYTNEAGNNYSLTRLQYYLSEIDLIRPDTTFLRIRNYQYIDARKTTTGKFNYTPSADQQFIGMRFYIGLAPAFNISHALPATIENIDMEWPDQMGGGYHFLKMEGNFRDGSNTYGYAMHLGTDTCLIPVTCWKNFSYSTRQTITLDLEMNINEWYRNPATYDFNTDGNYIMGIMAPMLKLKQNASDVFTLN
jgi:hypothetical protein